MKISKSSVMKLEGPQWLRQKRLRAWNSFSSLPEKPFYRYGLNIITPLEGMNPPELASGGNRIEIESTVRAENSAGDKRLFSSLNMENRFESMHMAFCSQFVYLKVPDNTSLPSPVIIRKTMSEKSFFEHAFIDVGKNCTLSILESLEAEETPTGRGYHSGGVEIFLGEGSSLLFVSTQNLPPRTNNFSIKNAFLSRDSALEWVTADMGSRLTLSRVCGIMEGQGSSLKTKMLVFGSGSQHFDFNVSSTHAAPHTQSDIVQKAVLDGKARMVMNGLVKIEQAAPHSVGYQKEDTLLLSPHAEASPIPNLEIDNNDVKCSHGTTVGQLDKNVLFYLMSRGLDEESAVRLAVKGFLEPLIAALPLKGLRNDIRRSIENKLGGKT
jgi:Fe-S cluster assembly protein SufD